MGDFSPESPIRPVFPLSSAIDGLGCFGDQISMKLAASRITGMQLYQEVSMSPFRLRRRIGPRPAFLGVDATAKVVGVAPFVEPERRSFG